MEHSVKSEWLALWDCVSTLHGHSFISFCCNQTWSSYFEITRSQIQYVQITCTCIPFTICPKGCKTLYHTTQSRLMFGYMWTYLYTVQEFTSIRLVTRLCSFCSWTKIRIPGSRCTAPHIYNLKQTLNQRYILLCCHPVLVHLTAIDKTEDKSD